MIPIIGIMLLLLSIGLAVTIVFNEKYSKVISTVVSLIVMELAILLLYVFLAGAAGSPGSISENYMYYISNFGISLNFVVNPVSLALILMASVVSFVTMLSGNVENENLKVSSILVLLFELAAIGLFASGNLFIFFIFWDVGVVALFFMIYLLGSANRRMAAIKFIMYELLASLLLLFAIMLIYFNTPLHSFDISYITANYSSIPVGTQALIFSLFFFAFLINMPVFPVHLWLPDAHTEASTQGSMLLSGVLTKFGGYGMILAFIMLPIANEFTPVIAILAGFSAFYAAFVLMTQHDIKRIIAYTTIVEMSIVLVGISAFSTLGIMGATYAMLAHGFAISMLFLVSGTIGYMFSDRDIRSVKGVVRNSISTAYTFLTGVFATTGVPLTAAFVGDVLIFIAAIQKFSLYGAIPLFSIMLMGAFLYYVVNKSILSTKDASKPVEYVGTSQRVGFSILLFFIFLFGVLPFIALSIFSNFSI